MIFNTSLSISFSVNSFLSKFSLIFLKISLSLKEEEYKSIKNCAASKDICKLISLQKIIFCKKLIQVGNSSLGQYSCNRRINSVNCLNIFISYFVICISFLIFKYSERKFIKYF